MFNVHIPILLIYLLHGEPDGGSPIGGSGGSLGSLGEDGSPMGVFSGLSSGGAIGGDLLSGAGGSLMGDGSLLFINPPAAVILFVADSRVSPLVHRSRVFTVPDELTIGGSPLPALHRHPRFEAADKSGHNFLARRL